MCDGWSKTRNEHIIDFVASLCKPIFCKSFHTDLQSHTGEYFATEILKVIEELEIECGKMVFGVVADNTSNMKKAWRLTEEKYPTAICYGCAAHGFNLIFCDMIKLETCKIIIKRAKGALKEFRLKHMLVDMLKAIEKGKNVNCTLKLPVKTRWASVVTSLKSVKKKVVLRKIAVSKARKKKQQLVKRSPAHSSG